MKSRQTIICEWSDEFSVTLDRGKPGEFRPGSKLGSKTCSGGRLWCATRHQFPTLFSENGDKNGWRLPSAEELRKAREDGVKGFTHRLYLDDNGGDGSRNTSVVDMITGLCSVVQYFEIELGEKFEVPCIRLIRYL